MLIIMTTPTRTSTPSKGISIAAWTASARSKVPKAAAQTRPERTAWGSTTTPADFLTCPTILSLQWILFVPTTASASSGPWVGYAYPSANSEKFSPDGAGTLVALPYRQSPNALPFGPTAAYGPNAPETFMILDRGTPVATNSIQLKFDGS